MICSYGCGKEAKYLFKNGKSCCSEHYRSCPEERRKLSESQKNGNAINLGRKFPKEFGDKVRSRQLGVKRGENKKKFSDETKHRISESTKGEKNPFYGKRHTEKTKLLMRINSKGKNKGIPKSDEHKNKISLAIRERFKDCNFCKEFGKRFIPKPTKPEKFLIPILDKFGYYYTGNFKFWIGGKNPDFTNIRDKKVIEFFGYMHTLEFRSKYRNNFKTNDEYQNERISHFKREGYKCLVLWNNDIKDIDVLNKKIYNFSKREK